MPEKVQNTPQKTSVPPSGKTVTEPEKKPADPSKVVIDKLRNALGWAPGKTKAFLTEGGDALLTQLADANVNQVVRLINDEVDRRLEAEGIELQKTKTKPKAATKK